MSGTGVLQEVLQEITVLAIWVFEMPKVVMWVDDWQGRLQCLFLHLCEPFVVIGHDLNPSIGLRWVMGFFRWYNKHY